MYENNGANNAELMNYVFIILLMFNDLKQLF